MLEINAFERMMRKAPLSANAQLLWYKLMNFDNLLHWEQWFSIDNDRLVKIGCIGSKNTTLAARDQLIANGYLIFQKGVKGKPSKYMLASAVELEAKAEHFEDNNT